MDYKLFLSAAFSSFWNWLVSGFFTVIGLLAFLYPIIQPQLNWLKFTQVLPPIVWFILALLIWLIGFTWNVINKMNEKIKDKGISNINQNKTEVKSENQSGGMIVGQANTIIQHNYPQIVNYPKANIDKSMAAHRICELAEDYERKFNLIGWSRILLEERQIQSSGRDIYIYRTQKALDSFVRLKEYVNDKKYLFDCRKELEICLFLIEIINTQYIKKIALWVELRAKQSLPNSIPEDLHGLNNLLFDSGADKTMRELDEIVENIIRLLTPYITGEK